MRIARFEQLASGIQWGRTYPQGNTETIRKLFFFRRFPEPGILSRVWPGRSHIEGTSGAPGAGPRYCSVDSVELEKHKIRMVDPESASASTIVGCGRWHAPHKVAIVNPETKKVCAKDEVGEIWVAGPSVAAGYWRNEAATQRAFGSLSGKGPFLRTGDLGFVYRRELFVTGRLKDCIIVRGRNHYPQDLEESVEESHSALRRNGSAASVWNRMDVKEWS